MEDECHANESLYVCLNDLDGKHQNSRQTIVKI